LPAAAGVLVSAATIGLLSASAAQAIPPTNFTWSGSNPLDGWSVGANWSGSDPGSAANIGTLSFPDLGSACDNGTSTNTCYDSTDDQGALTAQELSLDNSTGYQIAGESGSDSLTLTGNAGLGLDAVPTGDGYGFTDISLPVNLSSPQVWDIDGGTYGNFMAVDNVTSSDTLGVSFTNNAHLLTTDLNTGALTLDGDGTLISQTYNGNDASLPNHGITMDDGTNLWVESPNDTTGPLSVTGTTDGNEIRIGTGSIPQANLGVIGNLGLTSQSELSFLISGDDAANAASMDVAQNVTLDGATIDLAQAPDDTTGTACTDLTHGTTYTLISTGGSFTGNLRYVDSAGTTDLLSSGQTGGDMPIATYDNCQNANSSAYATGKLTYGTTEITLTIDSGGHVGDAPYRSGTTTVTGTPQVGVPLQASDTWSGNPSLTYTWYSCTAADPYCITTVGGSGPSYTPVASDQGNFISFCVNATNTYGSGEDCSDNTTAVAAAAASTHTTTTTPTTTTPTTTTPTTTTASSGPSQAQVSSALNGIGHPSGNKAITTLIKQSAFAASFIAPSGGSLTVRWTTVVTTGKGKHKKHKTVTVGTGSGHASATGKIGVKVRLTAAGKALLKRKPHGVRVTDTEKFQPTGGSWTTIVKHFTL
jgi:hypothetical protein